MVLQKEEVLKDDISLSQLKKASPLKLTPSLSTQLPPSSSIASASMKVDPHVKDYQDAAYELAAEIEKHGYDGEDLNEIFNRVGRESFLKELPKELRASYQNLEKKIQVLGQDQLKQDGMRESFFTKYQAQMPEWIKKHREELEKSPLPTRVQAMVTKKTNDPEIDNDEVNDILNGCGKGNTNCINKAFALLIDANHGLDDNQMKMIQEYL